MQARFLNRLASFSRLLLFDKRGVGLSDRVPVNQLPILEERIGDVRAVMDAAGSERAALFGVSEGGAMSALFAATHPDRTLALVLYGAFARAGARLISSAEFEESLRAIEDGWPDSIDPALPAPSLSGDEGYRQWFRSFLRHAASPGAAVALHRMNSEIDICEVLPAIHVPTLVLYRKDARFGHGAGAWRAVGEDLITPANEAAVIGRRVAGARVMELPGTDHLPWVGDADSCARRGGGVPDRSSSRARARPGAGDDSLHRHHGARGRRMRRRRMLARTRGAA